MAINNKEELEQGADVVANTETTETEDATMSLDEEVISIYKALIADNILNDKPSIYQTITYIYSKPKLLEACSEFFIDGSGWTNLPIAADDSFRAAIMESIKEENPVINIDQEWKKVLATQAKVAINKIPEDATTNTPLDPDTYGKSPAQQSFESTVNDAKDEIEKTADKTKGGDGDGLATIGFGILGLAALIGVGYAGYKAFDYMSDSGDVILVDNETADIF